MENSYPFPGKIFNIFLKQEGAAFLIGKFSLIFHFSVNFI